jgi:hypothetical protein
MKSTLPIIAKAGLLLATSAQAQTYSCDRLWFERNQIFANAGYCFKSRRAISVFGNAGCEYDNEHDVALTAPQARALHNIRYLERLGACPAEKFDPLPRG